MQSMTFFSECLWGEHKFDDLPGTSEVLALALKCEIHREGHEMFRMW